MVVRLSLLDRKEALYYPGTVDVSLCVDGYEIIGTCKVFRNESGNHFGELELDREVSGDLFFYYRGRANNAGIFVFAGLDLMPNEMEYNKTTTLKEMIVE